MSKLVYLGVIAALLTLTGCVTTQPDTLKPAASPPPALKPPPVTADQVTDENRVLIADALWAEIDRENQQNMLKSPPH
jgi:hypothetical protein